MVAPYSLSKLKELAACPSSGIHVKKVKKFPLLLHPLRSKNLKKGIKETLNELKSFNNLLEGCPIGYENVKVLPPGGWILDTNPHLHFLISTTFYVFSPKSGDVLQGTVTRKFPFHIACLVHEKYNVTLRKPKGCVDWPGEYVSVGDIINVKIDHVNMKLHIPYVSASFEDDGYQNAGPSSNSKITFSEDDSGFSTNEHHDTSDPLNTKLTFSDSDDEKDADIHITPLNDSELLESSNSSDENAGEKTKFIKKEKKVSPHNSPTDTKSKKKHKENLISNKKRKIHELSESSDDDFVIVEPKTKRSKVKDITPEPEIENSSDEECIKTKKKKKKDKKRKRKS